MFGIEQEGCELQLVELSPPRYLHHLPPGRDLACGPSPPSGHLNIAPPRCRAAVAALAQCISPGPRQGGEGRGKRSGQWRAGKFGVFCVNLRNIHNFFDYGIGIFGNCRHVVYVVGTWESAAKTRTCRDLTQKTSRGLSTFLLGAASIISKLCQVA